MSLRVLVIPEDPTNDQYILRPLVQRMLAEIGRPNATVRCLTNPRMTGYDHALETMRKELPQAYCHFQLWLFLPDSDRATDFRAIEHELDVQGIKLICCAAIPEVEAWCLAGHRQKLKTEWNLARANPRFKEEIFQPFLELYGNSRRPGNGREDLMRTTLTNYRSLLTVCPELELLERRIRDFLVLP